MSSYVKDKLYCIGRIRFCIGTMTLAVVDDANKVISLECGTAIIPLLSGITIQLGNMNIEKCVNMFD